MPPTPDDGPDLDDEAGPSLFEEMLAEAVEPMTVRIAGYVWTVEAPAAEDVADLDHCADAFDVLDDLLGDPLDGELHPLLEVLDGQPSWRTDDLAEKVLDHFHLVDAPPGGWAELVHRIDKYGPAIEADLPHEWPGIELTQWFTGRRRWPQLYRLLGQLGPGTRWDAALQSDVELAQQQLDAEAEQELSGDEERAREQPRPPLVGETYDRKLLRAAVSALLRIEHATYAVHARKGQGGRPPNPLPGPRTARDELMRDFGMDEVWEIFAAIEGRDVDEVGQDPPPSGYRTTDSGLVVPD